MPRHEPENARTMADVALSEDNSPPSKVRFIIINADEFSELPEPQWIIDEVLPDGDIVMITGATGAAKTFLALDMTVSIALGNPWRGHDVRQGRVVYIAAEGANGVRKRLKAYKKHYCVSFGDNFGVIADTPNLMQEDDIALAEDIKSQGGAKVIVLDTLAQVTPGASENSSEDMGKAPNPINNSPPPTIIGQKVKNNIANTIPPAIWNIKIIVLQSSWGFNRYYVANTPKPYLASG